MRQRRALSLNWMNPSYLGRWNPNQVSGYEKHLNLHSLLSQLAIPSSGCTRRDPLRRKGWMLWPGCGLWWQRSVGDCPFPGGLGDTKFWDLRRVVLEAEHSGSLQKPPSQALASRGFSRQGHCPPIGGSHLRPSGAEGTGSIQLEDTWAGVLGEHIPLLGELRGGGRGRVGT